MESLLRPLQSVGIPMAVAMERGMASQAVLGTRAAALRRELTVGSVKKKIAGTAGARFKRVTTLVSASTLRVRST